MLKFHINWVPGIFWFPLRLFWPTNYLEVCCSVSMCLENFLLFFLLISSMNPLVKEHICAWFQFFEFYWGLFYGPGYDIAWYIFSDHLKKCILVLLVAVFYKRPLDPVGFMVLWSFISLLVFCLIILCIVVKEVVKPPLITVDLSYFFLQFHQFLLHIFCTSIVRYIHI